MKKMSFVARFYEEEPIRFRCEACGACCHEWEGLVFIFKEEIAQMAGHLGVTERAFTKRYVSRTREGEHYLRLTDENACIFLEEDWRCRVHEVKPVLCRNFPVWDTVVYSKTDYERYLGLCLGLGQGERIPLKEIRRRLKENEKGPTPEDDRK